MYLIILFFIIDLSECYIGDYITFEDRVFKNNTFLYYYNPTKLPVDKKILTYNNKYFEFKCKNHKDCQRDWCSSGSICSNEGYCLNLMDYPCHHTMNCNSNLKICEPIQCYTLFQCDDNIYCNGQEICVERICKRTKHPCEYGTCIESIKECKNISSIGTNEMPQLRINIPNLYDSNFANISDIININLAGPPLWDANSLEVQVGWLVFACIIAVLVIGLYILYVFIPCCCKKRR